MLKDEILELLGNPSKILQGEVCNFANEKGLPFILLMIVIGNSEKEMKEAVLELIDDGKVWAYPWVYIQGKHENVKVEMKESLRSNCFAHIVILVK